jgi:predicted nucleic acid-binding protein
MHAVRMAALSGGVHRHKTIDHMTIRPHAFLSTLRALLTVHPLTVETHETGLELAERYGLSTFDATIAASALHAGCKTLWSEDMRHGMALGKDLRIANPFRDAN